MKKKRKSIPVIAAIAFCIMACCFQNPVFAKSDKETVTEGKDYYREFLVDNVLHSDRDGDIHYHVYFPDSYNGKKKMALYVTLPGYQGLYFQGVAENLKTEDFAKIIVKAVNGEYEKGSHINVTKQNVEELLND